MASVRKVCFQLRSRADATKTHVFDMDLRLAAELFDTVFDPLLEGTLSDMVIVDLDENDWASVTAEKLAHFCKICELVRDQDSDVETYVDEHFDVAPLMMKLLHALRLKPHFWQTRYYCLGTELFADKNKTFLTLTVYNETDDDIILEVTKDALFRVAAMPDGHWHVLVVPDDDGVEPPVSIILDFPDHTTAMDFLKNVRHAAGKTMQLAYAAGEEGDDLFNNMLYFATRNAAHIQLSEDRDAFMAMLSSEEAQLFEKNQHMSLTPVARLDTAAYTVAVAVTSIRIGESSCAPWISVNESERSAACAAPMI